jgi:glycosidase
VADELPDDTIEQIRGAVKHTDPDAFLLGEVWEDATTKQSYGRTRRYAYGRALDSVMNYPFLYKTVAFLRGEINAIAYRRFLVNQWLNYPPEMYYVLMNLLSSHDVARIRTALSMPMNAPNPRDMTRAEQAAYCVEEAQDALGGRLQRLATAIQFSVPGMPAIYYGDEVGMTGLLDPFNRRTWREEDAMIRDWYKKLAAARATHPVLRTGHALFYATNGNVLAVLRHALDGTDAFGKVIAPGAVLTIINPTNESHRIVIDLTEEKQCQTAEQRERFVRTAWTHAKSLVSDCVTPLSDDMFEIEIAPVTAELFQLIWV